MPREIDLQQTWFAGRPACHRYPGEDRMAHASYWAGERVLPVRGQAKAIVL